MFSRRAFAKLLGAAAIAATLAACQSLDPGLVASTAPAELSAAGASAIAGDLVGRFSEHVGPGTATIRLGQDSNPFGHALETALKSWGYAVVTDQKTDAADGKIVTLAYVVEPFEGQLLARLSTTSLDIGRVYQPTATGAAPLSPVSIQQRQSGSAK